MFTIIVIIRNKNTNTVMNVYIGIAFLNVLSILTSFKIFRAIL